jgi:hypothetical protein
MMHMSRTRSRMNTPVSVIAREPAPSTTSVAVPTSVKPVATPRGTATTR